MSLKGISNSKFKEQFIFFLNKINRLDNRYIRKWDTYLNHNKIFRLLKDNSTLTQLWSLA